MTSLEKSTSDLDRAVLRRCIPPMSQRRLQPRAYFLSPAELDARPTYSEDADGAQARYLAGELEGWIRRLEWAASRESHRTRALAVHQEIAELERQIMALHDRFPREFSSPVAPTHQQMSWEGSP